LTPERWAQIEELFHRAVECNAQDRVALLDEAGSADPELRRKVEELLSSDGSASTHVRDAIRFQLHEFGFPLVGKVISHYRILAGIGGGGMGLVYRAEDVRLGRRVALKFLPEESAHDPIALARFEREARSASALEHPNICPIYEFGEHDGRPFLVMQLLEGQTLRELISSALAQAKRPDLNQLCDLAIQILDGLGAAHSQGIIHRDIKPANIFVTREGQAKILDFGLAKLAREATPADDEWACTNSIHELVDLPSDETAAQATLDSPLSRTGVAVGTAGYMSPEQVRGEKLDARTDLFSFGLVIYEMATRQRAFPGETAVDLHHAILNDTPAPVRSVNPQIPARLESIINKAIEKDRNARYPTAESMRAELQKLRQQYAPKHFPRAWTAGLGVAIAALIGTVLFVLSRPPKTISVAPEIKLRQLTTNSTDNPVIGGAISPDGRYLAFSDTRGMHIKLLDTGETRTAPQPDELKDQRVKWGVGGWFPDSTRFLANAYPATEEWNEWNSDTGSIWAISVLGSNPVKIRDHALFCAVSPDGSTVSFATNKGKHGERELWFMGPNGERPKKYFEAKEGTGIDCWGWTPDGKHYGWVLNEESGSTILSQKIGGGPIVTIFTSEELKKTNDIVWLTDGRLIYDIAESDTGVTNYWVTRIDLDTGKRLEQPRRLTNWPSFRVASGSVTNDDKKFTFVAWSGFLTTDVADLNGGGARLSNVRRFSQEDADDYVAAWTADSKAVIVGHHSTLDRNGLYKQSLDADAPEVPLATIGPGWLNHAALTPDGKWLIALYWPPEQALSADHFIMPFPLLRIPTSGGAPQTIMQITSNVFVSCPKAASKICVIAEQSADKKQMIVSALDVMTGRGSELARSPLDGSIDLADNLICVISPDGSLLALARSAQGPVEIYSLNGQLIRQIPMHTSGKLLMLNWATDQNGFFLTTRAPGGTELLYVDLQGKAASLRKCLGTNACFAFPSRDGHHLAILDHKQAMNMWMMENF
jgi:serine/threonine protein kinase